MCGIFATTEADAWRPRLDQVLAQLHRRGPDERGQLAPADGIVLGHTRLSIIGLGGAGAQPATATDRSVSLTYGGEIYNYAELAHRHAFAPAQSDTQVLADLLATRTPAVLGELRGMFSFVSWDATSSVLSAMRDPYGIKPLYLLRHACGGVTLCSELPPLLLCPESRQIDELGLAQFLALGRSGSSMTLFEPIQKLVPGRLYQWRRVDDRRWECSIQAVPPYADHEERTVAAAVADSVEAHLVADVEVGAFLSGGVDSTLLCALANQRSPGLRTFTLSFPESPDRDESAGAQANAALMGARHTTVPVTRDEMGRCARDFVREHGEPFGDAAVMPLTFLSRAAAEHVKVVLCGEGADELFGGYARYRVSRLLGAPSRVLRPLTAPAAPWWARVRSGKPWARALEAGLWGGGVRSHTALLDGDLSLLAQLRPRAHDDLLDLVTADWSALSGRTDLARAQAYDRVRWLPNVYLEKTDRATMAAGLEARVPYLDPVVARAAGGIVRRDQAKTPLREALYHALPGVVLPDRKKGLAVDIVPTVQHHLGEPLRYELYDAGSVLNRWAGAGAGVRVAARASRSSYLLFRVAMLGLWESEFDGASFRCNG